MQSNMNHSMVGMLYFSQKQLPCKMKSRLVIIKCADYIFWQLLCGYSRIKNKPHTGLNLKTFSQSYDESNLEIDRSQQWFNYNFAFGELFI